MVIDFILGEPLGWFKDPIVGSLYLGVILLLFIYQALVGDSSFSDGSSVRYGFCFWS